MEIKATGNKYLSLMLCYASMLILPSYIHTAPVYASELPQKTVITDTHNQSWIPKIWKNYLAQDEKGLWLPDFSRAGYGMGRYALPDVVAPVFTVTHSNYGAFPDDGKDDTLAIQAAIHAAEAQGGGVVFLPQGRYDIRKDSHLDGIRVTGSHVVIRGEGEGPDGTVLQLWSSAPAGNVRRLGTVPADQAARSGAVLAVMGREDQEYITDITADVHRGEAVIKVADTSTLFVGQSVVISLTDPLVDPLDPRPEKAVIAAELTKPYKLIDQQVDTFGKAAQVYSWIVRVAEIIDTQTLRLGKPARFDHLLSYQPQIFTFSGVAGVGIENLRIESNWPGGYRHHKPYEENGVVVRSAKEQDYLWNGIWLSSLTDGWVKNVTFNNLTQGIIMSYCADSTFTELTFLGPEGHAGVTIGQSNDLLVSEVDFYAHFVHPITLTMMSSGNVFTDAEAHYDGRNEVTGTDAVIDFHGLFPFENLFEQLRGFYICPGGDMSVLPHGGVRNVFWNIVAPQKMSCYTGTGDDEFFRTYATVGTSSKSSATMYEHLPQAFFIGITRKGEKTVTIGNSSNDRNNKWHTVEGVGRKGIAVPSLYQAQRKEEQIKNQ